MCIEGCMLITYKDVLNGYIMPAGNETGHTQLQVRNIEYVAYYTFFLFTIIPKGSPGKIYFADRWHCTSGCIRTWNLLFLCTKIALNYVLLKPNLLRNAAKGRLKTWVGGRNLACRDLELHHLLYLFSS